MPKLQTNIDLQGCATLRLNNPEQHNAFDDQLIVELTTTLQQFDSTPQVRVVTLCASGKNFSAGADLNWMRRVSGFSPQENLQDAQALAKLLKTLNELSKPTIALIQGATLGGGIGLVAACDIALASKQASFCFSEVRLGLIAATISPYVLAAIGERAARRYLLSAERFSADEALRIGLVHQVVPPEQLEVRGQEFCQQLLQNGPQALVETKHLIRDIANQPIDDELSQLTAERIADIRTSAEGREGIIAFLQKRKPDWVKKN